MEINAGMFFDNDTNEESSMNSSMFELFGNSSTAIDANVTREPYVPYEQRLATYIVPAIFTLIFIIGVLGNGCLILIFFRHRAMRNVPNT